MSDAPDGPRNIASGTAPTGGATVPDKYTRLRRGPSPNMMPTSDLVVTVGSGTVARRPTGTRTGSAGPPHVPAGQVSGASPDAPRAAAPSAGAPR